MGAIDGLAEDLLDKVLGAVDFTPAGNVEVALSTTTPAADGTNITEPVGNGYARVTVTNNATEWPNASARLKQNANSIDFPLASGAWGTITHWVIYAQGGSALIFGPLDVSTAIDSGESASFAAGALQVTA